MKNFLQNCSKKYLKHINDRYFKDITKTNIKNIYSAILQLYNSFTGKGGTKIINYVTEYKGYNKHPISDSNFII